MRQQLLLFILIFSCTIRATAQTEQVFKTTRDSISGALSITKVTADSLVNDLFKIEQRRLNNLLDTISTYQQKHEKRLLLGIEREDILKKWLNAEQYQLWKQVYRGRLDPVMLAWKRNTAGTKPEGL
jgi:hypothetical protein